MLLLGILLICAAMPSGIADSLYAQSDENMGSPIVEMQFFDAIAAIKSSELKINTTYDFSIEGYPDEEHLLVLDFSNIGDNILKIFGDKVSKKSSCLTYHLKGADSCRNTWLQKYKNCPLQTLASQNIKMTLETKDLSKTSLVAYKTVNCTSGVEATQKSATTDCRQSSKAAGNGGLSTLEFILLIALAFASSLALIFATILHRMLCRRRRQSDKSSDEDFVYKQNSNEAEEVPAVLVDNVLYASIDGGATKM